MKYSMFEALNCKLGKLQSGSRFKPAVCEPDDRILSHERRIALGVHSRGSGAITRNNALQYSPPRFRSSRRIVRAPWEPPRSIAREEEAHGPPARQGKCFDYAITSLSLDS